MWPRSDERGILTIAFEPIAFEPIIHSELQCGRAPMSAESHGSQLTGDLPNACFNVAALR